MSRAAVLVVALLFGCASAASAGPVSEAEARRAEESARKADERRATMAFFAGAICAAFGGLLVWVGVGVARNGFGFGTGLRRVTGAPAWAVAALLVAAGAAVAVLGLRYASVLVSRL